MDDARMKLQITNPYPARVEGTDNPMIQGAYQKWLRSGLPLDAWFDYLTKVKMFKPEMANPRGNLTGGDGMKGFGPAPLPVVDLKPSSRMPELPAAAQVGPPPLSRTPGSVPGTSSPVAKIDPASMAGPPPNPASAAPMMGLLEGSPEQQAQGRSNLPLSLGLLSFGANMFSNTNPRNHLLPYTLGEKLRDSLGAGLGTFTTFDRMMNPKQDKNFDLVEVKQGNDIVTYKKFKDGSMQQMASSPRSQAKPDGKWTTVKDPFGFGGVAQKNSVTGEIKNYHGPKVEKDAIVEDVNGYKYAKGEGGKFVRLFPDVVRESKDAAPSTLSKLIKERDELPKGSPLRDLYDAQINKLNTHQPGTNIEVKTGGKIVEAFGKGASDRFFKEQEDAEGAVAGIANLNDAEAILNQGIITGSGADALTGFNSFLVNRLGLDVNKDAVSNTQAFAATIGNQVGQIIKQFGSGTGLSDADRKYAERIAGGDISLSEDAIRKLLSINRKVYVAKIDRFNKKAAQVMERFGDQMPFDLMVEMPAGGGGKNNIPEPPPGFKRVN